MIEGQTEPLPYATPAPSSRPLWASAILSVLSLGLIGLSGCFLIGVGLAYDLIGVTAVHRRVFSTGQSFFVGVLYLCAAVTFLSGLYVALLAVRRLER